jgi:hypothetical protein
MVTKEELKKDLKNIKRINNYGKMIYAFGWITWVIETVMFLLRYGWHTKAINDKEKIYDIMSGHIMLVGLILLVIAMYKAHLLHIKFLEDES